MGWAQTDMTYAVGLLLCSQVQNTELGVICKHAEGTELKSTCLTSCEAACEAGLQKWETDNQIRTGFVLLDKDRTRLVKSCTRECTTDCTRPGKDLLEKLV